MMSLTRIGVVMSALAFSACASPGPDTILFNGKIFTANPAELWVEAVAIRGGRIVAIGTNSTMARQGGSSTRRLNLGGRTVVPGLNDAHVTVSRPTIDTVRLLGADAIASGVTSLQVFSEGPVADTVLVFRDADLPQRVRVIRMPEPDPSGVNRDSRPYFPPQPGPRLDVRGMGFALGATDGKRLQQAVGWAYGSEDPLAIACRDAAMVEVYVTALETGGAPEVWTAKRPRIEGPASLPADAAARLPRLGVVIVQSPWPGAAVPLKSILTASIPLALGSGASLRGFDLIRSASDPLQGSEALTREDAVMVYTLGSAFSESTERDKGRLAVGLLADLAVLSADLFSVPPQFIPEIRSVMTIVGGRVVHDAGVVR